MKLTYTGTFNAPVLMEELLAAFPDWLYTQNGETQCALSLQAKPDGTEVYLDVPDNSDVAAIQAVIEAHDPMKLTPAEQAEQARAAIIESLRKPWSQWTTGDQVNFIRVLAEQAGIIPLG